MAFGVFPIFNFYQQPNSGATGGPWPEITPENSGVVFGDNGKSGTVADFNWYYPYAGTNYDLFLLRAGKEFHRMDSYADSAQLGVGSLTPISLFSGKIGGEGDRSFVTTSWEGFISPQDVGQFSGQSLFSGLITGNPLPKMEFLYLFSGKMSGQNYDRPTIYSLMSGYFKATGNWCFINSACSGIIKGTAPDSETWFTSFRGKVTPVFGSSGSISYGFDSFSTSTDVRVVARSAESEASVSYLISEIVITR